jgi:transposase
VAFDTTRDAETRLRYQMVLLAGDGLTAPPIAPLVRRSEATVQRVLHRYRAGGLPAVPHRPRPGAAPAVPPAWEAELCRVIELDPHDVGVPSSLWTTGLLAGYLAGRTGHATSDETVRRSLHRHDYGGKRPKWTLKRTAEEQPDWAGNG